MAKRSSRSGGRAASKRAKAPPAPPAGVIATSDTDRDKAIRAMLALLSEHPWIEIGLTDIAEEAGLSLSALRNAFNSPFAILAAFIKDVDRAVLDTVSPSEDETPRERLFEVLMQRLDILAPYKPAIRSLVQSARRNPPLALALNGLAVQSQHWMLTAAGIRVQGPKGMIRAQGLALVFARVVAVWSDDDEPGQDRTMAALDRGLASGQRWSGFLDDLFCIPAGLARASRARRRRYRENADGYDDNETSAA